MGEFSVGHGTKVSAFPFYVPTAPAKGTAAPAPPATPFPTAGCCTWYLPDGCQEVVTDGVVQVDATAECNESQSNCESVCAGTWLSDPATPGPTPGPTPPAPTGETCLATKTNRTFCGVGKVHDDAADGVECAADVCKSPEDIDACCLVPDKTYCPGGYVDPAITQ